MAEQIETIHGTHHITDPAYNAAAEQVENKLHIEIVPGTEVLTDVGGIHLVHGRKGDGSEGGVLIPQPSADPHDPLV